MAKETPSDQNEATESRWDRAYRAVEQARASGEKPEASSVKDLTKSVGGSSR
jgi:hypothetical protein